VEEMDKKEISYPQTIKSPVRGILTGLEGIGNEERRETLFRLTISSGNYCAILELIL
jgi:hypothetical protein